jgi:hypothetical protein
MKKISLKIPDREKDILTAMYDLAHETQTNRSHIFHDKGVECKLIPLIGENMRIGGEKLILSKRKVGDLIKPKYWSKVMELKLMKRKNHKNFEYLEFVDKVITKEDKGAWID